MSRKVIGLDIRDDAIAAILVKSGIKGSWIEDYVYVPISEPKPSVPLKEEENEDEEINSGIVTAMETICKRIDTSSAACVVSFPANHISYRNIQLPFKDAKKIRQILPFELESKLPFPIDDLVIDFQILSNHRISSDSKNHTDIITAAVETSRLKSYWDALLSFKLEPEMITIGGYPAVCCLLKFAKIPEQWLFADIYKNKCTLFAIASKQICLVRSFSVPSKHEYRTEILFTHIQHTLDAFEESFHWNFEPTQLYMSIDDPVILSQSRNFEQKAEYILNIPTQLADIAQNAGVTTKTSSKQGTEQEKIEPGMNNPLALALMEIEGFNGFDFRKGPFAPRKEWAEHKGSLIKIGLLLILVLGTIFLNMMIDSYSMEKKVAELDRQITQIFKSTFPEVTRIVKPLHQMQVAMEDLKKTDMLPGETGRNIKTIDIINEISNVISKSIDVEFTQLVISEDNVQISGETDTFNSVDDMQSKLEKSDLFKKVIISNTSKKKTENRIQFKIRIQL